MKRKGVTHEFDTCPGPLVTSALASLGVVISALLAISCVDNLPSTSRTGSVQKVLIGTALSPPQVTLVPGDEVRWVNKQDGPVMIVFLTPIEEQLTCGRGFGLGGVTNAARLAPNKSLSLCFAAPGRVRYTVHLNTPTVTGEWNFLGIVDVTPPNDSP